ncbi:hypothetical protein Sjap_015293 [Stephania japonica]|uniref:Uncharacterized protein n=1 Tax=Stephania japonica TaxID=461633 RepID=A0AAP0IIU5_9MAGN
MGGQRRQGWLEKERRGEERRRRQWMSGAWAMRPSWSRGDVNGGAYRGDDGGVDRSRAEWRRRWRSGAEVKAEQRGDDGVEVMMVEETTMAEQQPPEGTTAEKRGLRKMAEQNLLLDWVRFLLPRKTSKNGGYLGHCFSYKQGMPHKKSLVTWEKAGVGISRRGEEVASRDEGEKVVKSYVERGESSGDDETSKEDHDGDGDHNESSSSESRGELVKKTKEGMMEMIIVKRMVMVMMIVIVKN